jgi:NMD protein affecting ribosome stability and mRNA decay
MVHDPYKSKRKLAEPAVCPGCNAVFRNGRWQWADAWPADAPRETCQACHRVHDRYPAGILTLAGDYARGHRTEIVNLARRIERDELAQHPLHRIMNIESRGEGLVITTTDIHLPRRIADAVRHAHKGVLQVHYDREGYLLRVLWTRPLERQPSRRARG